MPGKSPPETKDGHKEQQPHNKGRQAGYHKQCQENHHLKQKMDIKNNSDTTKDAKKDITNNARKITT